MSKKRLQNHIEARKAAWTNNEPVLNSEHYQSSLSGAVTFYAQYVSDLDLQKWAISHWKSQHKDVKGLEKLNTGFFRQVGILSRLIKKEQPVSPVHLKYIENKYETLIGYVKTESGPKASTAVKLPNIQERILDLASQHIAEFDAASDEWVKGSKTFDPKQYLSSNQVKAPIASKIAAHLKPQIAEIEECLNGEDKQLVEGYSNFTKPALKRYLTFLTECKTACETMAVIAKMTKAPRKRKEKPASVLVAKMKYMRESTEYKLRSVHPEKIVGATEVWIFNTKYRKLQRYVAQDGMMFSAKGTTILNWDPEKSSAKTIRKPEVVLNGIAALGKRPISNLFKEIKSVEAKVNGRLGDECIIVSVF